MVKHDYQLEVGNESRVAIAGERRTQVGGHDYLNVAGNRQHEVGETLVYQVGQEVHIKLCTHIVVQGSESLTLSAGGQHILINPDGIFSSKLIEIGGVPLKSANLAKSQQQGAAAGLEYEAFVNPLQKAVSTPRAFFLFSE